MPRMEDKAVSGEKSSLPQDKSGSGDMKIAELFQMLCKRMDSHFEMQDKKHEALEEDIRNTKSAPRTTAASGAATTSSRHEYSRLEK